MNWRAKPGRASRLAGVYVSMELPVKRCDFLCSHSWAVERSGKTPFAVGNTGRKPSELCSKTIIGEEIEKNRPHPACCFIGVKSSSFTKCSYSFGFTLCSLTSEEHEE